MFRNRWTYALSNAVTTLGIYLMIRWLFDEDPFSWGAPIALAAGYLAGHAVWPVFAWMKRNGRRGDHGSQ